MTKPELILGTAEFGHPSYDPHPDKKEIIRILNLAWESGIRTLDTADSYHTEHLEPYFGGFKRLFKSRTAREAFYHYKPLESPIRFIKRASVYDLEQLEGLREVIVPLSLNNTKFVDKLDQINIVYARSVFDNGKLLQEGYSVRDCLSFVKRQPVNGVIVGVRSVKELMEILTSY